MYTCIHKVHTYIHTYIYLSISISISVSIYASMHLSICLSIYIYIYIYTDLSTYIYLYVHILTRGKSLTTLCPPLCISASLLLCTNPPVKSASLRRVRWVRWRRASVSISITIYLSISRVNPRSISICTYLTRGEVTDNPAPLPSPHPRV